MHQKLFCYTLLGILATSIAGTLFHFIYEWSGNSFFIGLIAPVNESVWEHMKLLFFPMLFYCGLESTLLKKYFPSIACANSAAILIGTFAIPTLFYTYSGILGTNYAVLDIALYYVSVIIAFAFRYLLAKKGISKTQCLWLEAAILLLMACFMVFTLHPPDIGIFTIPS